MEGHTLLWTYVTPDQFKAIPRFKWFNPTHFSILLTYKSNTLPAPTSFATATLLLKSTPPGVTDSLFEKSPVSIQVHKQHRFRPKINGDRKSIPRPLVDHPIGPDYTEYFGRSKESPQLNGCSLISVSTCHQRLRLSTFISANFGLNPGRLYPFARVRTSPPGEPLSPCTEERFTL